LGDRDAETTRGLDNAEVGINMEVSQDMSDNDTENVVNEAEVMDSLGEPQEEVANDDSHESPGNQGGSRDTLSVQKRLKAQRRAHDREMREMQSRMDQMQAMMQQNNPNQQPQPQQDPFGAAAGSGDGTQDAIRQAVTYALQQKEMSERQARESEAQQHIAKQYAELNRHLDSTADKYDDFDDVVRGDVPFTEAMRDAALLLPKKGQGSAGEVLYHLGKNPEELARIGKLPKINQASEVIALSQALMSGGESKNNHSARPLGQIKSNPVVNATGVHEKTPVSEIRNRMKKGTFK
jgi:hypothetical protein